MPISTRLQLLLVVLCLTTGRPESVTAAAGVLLLIGLRALARRRLLSPARTAGFAPIRRGPEVHPYG